MGKKRKLSKVGALFVVFTMLLQLVPVGIVTANGPFAGGDGTAGDPYQINDAAQLNSVRDYLDKHFILTADINLDVDPYNSGAGWVPIGSWIPRSVFKGNFDGNGKTITGLYINRPNKNEVGLFGYTDNAVIKNVRLVGVNVTGQYQVGSLVGETWESLITNCYATGNVEGSSNTGGLVGANGGYEEDSTIENSYATGTVTGSSNTGGLVGVNGFGGTIRDSFATGNVTGESNTGGLVGANLSTIIDSYAAGTVTGNNNVGGLAGQSGNWMAPGTVTNSYATGNVTGGENTGGLVGSHGDNGCAGSKIENSYATGNVTGTGESAIVGGLVGYNEQGDIENSYATGNVTGTGESAIVGGLVGTYDNGTITASYYDRQTTGQNDTGKGTPKTTAQMKQRVTFDGWNFADIWAIVDTDTHWSYPYLQWMEWDEEDDKPGYSLKFGGGSGTGGDPYLISSADHLNNVRYFLDKHFKLYVDIDLNENEAPYNSGAGWEPIGTSAAPFTGAFDGNNKTISNLTIGSLENPNSTLHYVGLFGNVNSVIKDLSITGAEIYTSNGQYVGILAGRSSGGEITNVHVDGIIVNSKNTSRTGGFVGSLSEPGTIDSCSAAGTVTGGGENSPVGGFVGSNFGTILNSSATSNVTGGNGAYTFVGGFAGENGGAVLTIKNSYATGNVNAGDEASVGGFVGFNTKRVINCYASGNVSGGTDAILGGFAGQNLYNELFSYDGELINTYHNSAAYADAVGLDTGTRESSAAMPASAMRAAAGQAGALVDILNVNRNNADDPAWLYWRQNASVNNGFPSLAETPSVHQSPPPASAPEYAPLSAPVLLDGQTQQQAATVSTQIRDGRRVTTVTLDTKIMTELVNASRTGSTVTIPLSNTAADVAVGVLNGELVKAMENKRAVVEIKTDTATYTLPAQQINIDAVSAKLGQDVKLSEIKISIEIASTSGDQVKVVEDAAAKGNFSIVVPPVDFSVKATYGDKTVEISQFNAYVERAVAIPDGVDPAKVTTAIVVDPDGTVRHVPTKVIVIDGKYYAQINSLTNSTYTVIWNPLEFKDVAGHWAGEAVNEMGSRLVISGVGEGRFEPDQEITRAEFAAIVVRALGLKPGNGSNPFADVSNSAWYRGYVKTAAEYRLISGYGDGKFGPMDKITREQAMTIVARAMTINGLIVVLEPGEAGRLLAGFRDGDKTADYAKNDIAACIKSGIVTGRNGDLLVPKDSITRAEVAVIVRRLLQKSKLI